MLRVVHGIDGESPLAGVDKGVARDGRATSPCSARIDCADTEGGQAVTWCVLPEGHNGQHTGVSPRPLAHNTFDPTRKR